MIVGEVVQGQGRSSSSQVYNTSIYESLNLAPPSPEPFLAAMPSAYQCDCLDLSMSFLNIRG